MFERLHFLVLYVGSAALTAFLAACLSSPELGTMSCHTSGADGSQRCEFPATLAAAVAPEAGMGADDILAPDLSTLDLATTAIAAGQ